MGKQIVCGSCGAEFDDELAKCPYCGTMNLKGAEREYMEKLEDVREDMEELTNLPAEELKKSLRKQGKKVWRVVLIFGIIILAVIGSVTFLLGRDNRDYKAEYLWKEEHFPVLNELYEEERYEEMFEYMYAPENNGKEAVFYQWEHYKFADDYQKCLMVEEYLQTEERRELSEDNLASLLFYQWEIKGMIQNPGNYTEREWKVLEPCIEASEQDYEARWNFSDEQTKELEAEFESYQRTFITFNTCQKTVKNWIKENR